MTLEEALAASEAEPVNDIFAVNPESRTITVPETEKIFGVFSDGNTERKHFRCPKVVGDGIDLTTLHLYINYQNANGKKYPYLVEDVQADGDYITFSWLISPDVVSYKGTVKFVLCAKKGTELEWNTTIAEGTVLEGLEATDEVVERNPDIIEQILTRLDNVTEIPQEKVAEAVSTYMEANPINVPKNLSDLKEDAEHRTVTDKEKQSWNNTSGTGLPDTAKKLLIAILKNAVYTVKQKANIEALENALSTQNTPTDAWSIVQNLTYVTSTNTAFNVKKGESYTTTIVPNTNYKINSVTVVMGGVDITNTAYNNGVITINSVTGNVTITAIAKKNSGALLPSDGLLANFDFRNKEMTSYNLSGWGNVYKCDDETGNYFTFGGSAKTASQGGIERYMFRDVRKKDNESKSVDLGTDFTTAMYSTEVPNILNSAKKAMCRLEKSYLPQGI